MSSGWVQHVLDLAKLREIDGMFSYDLQASDANIAHYRDIGGAHFFERSAEPFAMSTLDTPVYRDIVRDALISVESAAVILDVGGGDGRLAWPLLESGRRVIVLDAAGEALLRFRDRVAQRHPDWLERLALIEGDMRDIPVRSSSIDAAIAIESLYYLNEEYEAGLEGVIRTLKPGGLFVTSERSFEGQLVLQLLYEGLAAMLDGSSRRAIVDGKNSGLRSRTFTLEELLNIIEARGMRVMRHTGTPILSLIIGWLRGREQFTHADEARAAELQSLLSDLSRNGHMRRCNVVIATKPE